MKPVSAGFIIRSAGKYLICHATQDTTFKMDNIHWTISKGMVEEGETSINAAIRELKEETGIDLRNDVQVDGLESLMPIKILPLSKKIIHAYYIDDPNGILQEKELHCSSKIDNKTHRLYGYPEMDAYLWVSKETATKLVFDTQKSLFDELP